MRRTMFVVVMCGCGARSMLDGSDLFSSDAAIDQAAFDAIPSDGFVFGGQDAAPGADGNVDGCTPAVIAIGCGGSQQNCLSCKFDIEWTCGDVKHRIGGACDPPDVGVLGGLYDGVCDQNGAQTNTFDIATTTCDCKDA